MERRQFIQALSSSFALGATTGCHHLVKKKAQKVEAKTKVKAPPSQTPLTVAPSAPPKIIKPSQPLHTYDRVTPAVPDKVSDRQKKSRHFKKTFEDDVFIDPHKIKILKSVNAKLWHTKKYIGFAHFNLISFDEFISHCKRSSRIRALTHQELEFLDQIFHEDAKRYGFFGDKPITNLTDQINKKDAIKIPGTGHYVYDGDAFKLYNKIRKEVGPSIVLTSGIRSVVKQIHLFLSKTIKVGGNLSKASRSLAPPGHSYHGIGDFDVGKRGYGMRNFTNKFATTEEYKKLISSGYVKIRYTEDNPFGVRYEPWHIKVIS